MPPRKQRSRIVLRATITADGKLMGDVSGGGEGDLRRQLENGQVDEIRLTVRPKIDGRRDAATLSGAGGAFFPASVACRLLRMETVGAECLLHYRVLRGGGASVRKL